jgi:hypothetical protein
MNISLNSLMHYTKREVTVDVTTPDLVLLASKMFFHLCGGTLGTAATTGLLYQPRMIVMIVEKFVE